MDTPYQWTKQIASHWGGTRNGTIVHWPQGIAAKGDVRNQFTHVIDVAPTVLEAAGLPAPTLVNGVLQEARRHGRSYGATSTMPVHNRNNSMIPEMSNTRLEVRRGEGHGHVQIADRAMSDIDFSHHRSDTGFEPQ